MKELHFLAKIESETEWRSLFQQYEYSLGKTNEQGNRHTKCVRLPNGPVYKVYSLSKTQNRYVLCVKNDRLMKTMDSYLKC